MAWGLLEVALFVIGGILYLILLALLYLVIKLRFIENHRSSSEAKNCICTCNHCPDYHEDIEEALSKSNPSSSILPLSKD